MSYIHPKAGGHYSVQALGEDHWRLAEFTPELDLPWRFCDEVGGTAREVRSWSPLPPHPPLPSERTPHQELAAKLRAMADQIEKSGNAEPDMPLATDEGIYFGNWDFSAPQFTPGTAILIVSEKQVLFPMARKLAWRYLPEMQKELATNLETVRKFCHNCSHAAGRFNSHAKLSVEQIRSLRDEYLNGAFIDDLAEKYDLSRMYTSAIVRGKVLGLAPLPQHPPKPHSKKYNRLSVDVVIKLRADRTAGLSYRALGKKHGVKEHTVKCAVDGSYWKWVPFLKKGQSKDEYLLEAIAWRSGIANEGERRGGVANCADRPRVVQKPRVSVGRLRRRARRPGREAGQVQRSVCVGA